MTASNLGTNAATFVSSDPASGPGANPLGSAMAAATSDAAAVSSTAPTILASLVGLLPEASSALSGGSPLPAAVHASAAQLLSINTNANSLQPNVIVHWPS